MPGRVRRRHDAVNLVPLRVAWREVVAVSAKFGTQRAAGRVGVRRWGIRAGLEVGGLPNERKVRLERA